MSVSAIVFIVAASLAGLVLGALVIAWLGQHKRASRLQAELEKSTQNQDALELRLRESAAQASERKAEAEQLRAQALNLQSRFDATNSELLKRTAAFAAMEATSREQAASSAEKLVLLEKAELRLRESFQNLANQILDSKAERFKEQNKEQLGSLLDPFKVQLNEFREAFTQTHANEQRERGMLAQEIRSLKDLNLQISQDAINLTRALKGDAQTQGAWGEMVLERVLEASGLQSGREYEVQQSFQDDDGSRQRPDVIVRLPEGKDIIIDAKVSLVAWERLVGAETETERTTALREHQASLKRHIDGLSVRNYSDLAEVRTLDFVPLLVPVEAALIEAVRADGNLYSYALDRRISLVSPSTLLATLRTVAYLWRIENRNSNAIEIARRAANLHDNFVSLLNELEVLGSQLDKAHNAHAAVLRRLTEGGKGSVILQVNSLAEMGAPAKKTMPKRLIESAGAERDPSSSEIDDAGDAHGSADDS
ncbi:MAG: DNA recombination protein RmuC [Gammaproteobacteria bacterium]|nr:MAG: DNA recombination protein RmuC [Gammaproteobacteria bacterium]